MEGGCRPGVETQQGSTRKGAWQSRCRETQRDPGARTTAHSLQQAGRQPADRGEACEHPWSSWSLEGQGPHTSGCTLAQSHPGARTTGSWESGAGGRPGSGTRMGLLPPCCTHVGWAGARATGQAESGVLNKPAMGEWEGPGPALGAVAPQGPPAPGGRPAEKNGPLPLSEGWGLTPGEETTTDLKAHIWLGAWLGGNTVSPSLVTQ